MLAIRQPKLLHKVPAVPAELPGPWLERNRGGVATVVASIVVVVLYVTLDAVSFVFPYLPFPVTPWNPNAGLAIAMTVAGGRRYAPSIVIAALTSELLLRAEGSSIFASLGAGLGLGAAYALTGLAVRFLVPHPSLERVRDLRTFFIVVVVGTACSAASFVQFNLPSDVPIPTLFAAFLRMWLGDLTGTFGTAPILLMLDRAAGEHGPHHVPYQRTWLRDVGFFLLVLVPLLTIVFGLEPIEGHKLFYLLFVPLIALAMRHGFAGAAIGVAIVQVALIGVLVFTGQSAQSATEFQLLMLVLALTTLLLGAVASERRGALLELERRSLELRAHQAALADASRVAAVSEMSMALVHEVAQPLSAIGSYARAGLEMLRSGNSQPAELAKALERVEKEAARSGKTVRRIRDFFRSGASEFEPVDIAGLVEEAVGSVRDRAEEKNAQLRTTIATGLPRVLADRVQIGTVLHNLLTNALDAAIDAKTPPVVEVRVKASSLGWISIDVIDSGAGIEPSLGESLFEPLATTKPTGMGLGLAISRRLAQAHGGQLVLLDGRPTIFQLTLPVR